MGRTLLITEIKAHRRLSRQRTYLRKIHRIMFNSRVNTTLKIIAVPRGNLNEKPGRSIRMSPGRFPKGSPHFPNSHMNAPTAARPRPAIIIHLPIFEGSITPDSRGRAFLSSIPESFFGKHLRPWLLEYSLEPKFLKSRRRGNSWVIQPEDDFHQVGRKIRTAIAVGGSNHGLNSACHC